jgi:hypothetical protein
MAQAVKKTDVIILVENLTGTAAPEPVCNRIRFEGLTRLQSSPTLGEYFV